MVAQWRWLQAFIPQVKNNSNDTFTDSEIGGTVEITSVTDKSDSNYNDAYNENGGKSYHAATDETIAVKAVASSGYKFLGWYDESGNLVSANPEYGYFETKESVKTYYARFSNEITQTYIRQVKDGDGWVDIEGTDNSPVGNLDRYSYTDAAGKPISSTAAAGSGYGFVGWYDAEGNKVADNMLINDGATISYITTVDATYYARFMPTVTQTFIRRVLNGDTWVDTTNNGIGTLDCYTHTDLPGVTVSSTATAGPGYQFIGWYDAEGNQVPDNMLINNGATISYTTEGNATYYAYFEKMYSLNVSKIDGTQSTEENKVPLANAEFALYRKDDSGDKTIIYQGEAVTCTLLSSGRTAMNPEGTKAIAVFTGMIFPGTEYYLVETKAPSGYRLLNTPLKITIDGSGDTALIDGISKEITDKEVNVELANYLTLCMPTSGTIVTGSWYTAVGLTLLAAAAIGLLGYETSRLKKTKK